MKQSIYAHRVLRCKLRIMGITTSDPSYFYLDNMSVVGNKSRPEPVLRKAIHFVIMQSIALSKSLVSHLSNRNVAE